MSRRQSQTTMLRPLPIGQELIVNIVFVAISAGFDHLSKFFEVAPGVSIWYPPAGMSVAFATLMGWRSIPALVVCNILSFAWIHPSDRSFLVDLLIGIAHTGCYGGAGYLLRRWFARDGLNTTVNAVRFLGIVFLSPILVSMVGGASLFDPATPPTLIELIYGWWIGDVIGILVMTPFMMVTIFPLLRLGGWPGRQVEQRPIWLIITELSAHVVGLLILLQVIFYSDLASQPPFYLLFIPLVIAAIRYGIDGVAIAIWLINIATSVYAASTGYPIDRLIGLQMLLMVIGLIGLVLGATITNRWMVEGVLSENEARAQAIIQDQTELVCRYDSTLTLTFVNDAYCRFFQKRREDLIGRSFLPLTRPEYHDIIRHQVEQIIATHEVLVDESQIMRGDGSVRWLQWFNRAIMDRNGVVVEVQVVGRDITEQKYAEAALQRSEDRYRVISELTSDFAAAYIVYDEDNAVREWSLGPFRTITGYNIEEFDLQGGWASIVHPADKERFLTQRLALTRGENFETEFRIIAKDGRVVWLHMVGNAVPGAAEEPLMRVHIAVSDITDRKETEERQRAIEQRIQETQKFESIGVLAGGVAHDFNNLLVGVLGNAEIVLATMPPDDPNYETVLRIQRAALHAADLTRQLLAYAGKGQVMVQQQDVNLLIDELLQLVAANLTTTIQVSCDLAASLPAIAGDRTQLLQVLVNLVINAAEAIGDRPGTIQITTQTIEIGHVDPRLGYRGADLYPGRYVQIAVSDSGSGMDLRTLEHLFEPFFTTKFTGRGLGLAASLGIIRSHAGAIRVESSIGQGTTFTIVLPALALPTVHS
ncbi:MAG: hypothetical protein Fur005_36190 [Roseiflexaceae bacterium]